LLMILDPGFQWWCHYHKWWCYHLETDAGSSPCS